MSEEQHHCKTSTRIIILLINRTNKIIISVTKYHSKI